jgi:type I restriction enzyme S subunit
MMSKEKRRVPKLRFPGFTEDWEQRKLSDISTKVTTKNVDVHYTETLTNSAEQGIISQVDFFDKEISNKDNINGYYIVDNNDFIYNPRISTLAPVGPINRNKLNRTGIMSPLYTVFRSSNIDLSFLEWYFQSNHWHRYMKLNGDSGARADRIAIKDSTFFEMPIKIPVNIKEQVLIGETLEKFNQYITLHQRKLDNLKLKKKALLQKLFPKNGERYPELRFPGFTDAWEQRKLIDIAKTFIGLVTTMTENYRDSGTLLIRNSDIKEGQFEFSENPIHLDEEFAEKNKTRKLQIGDVVTVHTGDIGTSAVIEEKEAGAIGFATINTRTDKSVLNPYFLATYFNTEKHKCYANSVSTGDGRSNYNIKDFNKLVISIPTLDEQERISVLINDINTIITLHQ